MKRLIVILTVNMIYTSLCLSQMNDSISIIKVNEFGIGLNGMNGLIGSDQAPSFSLSYKRYLNKVNLRCGIYFSEDNNSSYFASGEFVTDSIFLSKSSWDTEINYGLILGLDKSKNITGTISYFYGINIIATYIKKNQFLNPSYYYLNGKNLGGSNYLNKVLYGQKFGINPVIGLKQNILPFIGLTIEVSLIASYAEIKSMSSYFNLDENIRLLLNYNF